MEISFTLDEAPAVVVVVAVAVVFAWVVGAAVVSVAFFSPFPQAATINADRSVTEPNKILFFQDSCSPQQIYYICIISRYGLNLNKKTFYKG